MQAFDLNMLPFLQWLLKASLQGSLLIGFIFLIKSLLRDRLPVRWYSYLWLLLLLRLALPWAPASRISVFNLIPDHARPGHTEITSSSVDVTPESTNSQQPVTQGPPVPTSPERAPTVDDAGVGRSDPGTLDQSLPERGTGTLAWIWLAGAVGLAGAICIRNLGLWRAVKQERPVTDQTLLDLLEDSKLQMGVQTIVGVIVTDRVRSPALFGFVRPRLLLPQGLIETLDSEELQHIFLHELAHLKRRDIHLGWLVTLLQVMHWFNPLIWLALCRMRSDQEVACDRLVLSTLQADEPAKYGQTIVKLFERYSQINYLPSLAGILEDASQLERRIVMIANPSRKSRAQSLVATLLLVALSCVVLTDAHPAPATVDSLDQKVPTDLQRHVLLYLSFDRDGGTRAVDVSGMDFHGELHGCAYSTEGRIGGAMRFDGEDDCISISGIKLHAFTFAAWVRPNTESMNNRRLFLLDGGEQYYAVQGTSRGDVELSGGDFADDDPLPIPQREFAMNEWTYVSTTYDGEVFRVYKNGVLARSGRASRDSLTGTAYLGGTEKFRGRYWHGLMDEVALFNRALTVHEIQQLHSLAGGVTTPLFDMSSTVDSDTRGLAQFAGVWTGLAVDKPEDGTSRDSLTLDLKVDASGHLTGIAAGEFVNDGYCRLTNIEVNGNQISFEVRHRFRNMRMGIRLKLQGDKLQGEGQPIEDDDDRCDIVLQREARGRPRVDRPESRRSGPILQYSFNRFQGATVTDESGQGCHAQVYGARYESNGRVGGAMSFDGYDDYISTPDISLREFTFAAWVKTETDRLNNRRLLLLSDGTRCYALQANIGRSLGVYVADDVEVNEYDWAFRVGQWTHIAVTHDGSVFKIYRDGKLTQTGYIATDGVTGTLHIGGTNRHRGGFWQGMIDEVFVYNRALNDLEVEQLYSRAIEASQVGVFRTGRPERPRVHTSAFRSVSEFLGVWTGKAVDKPGEGNTTNSLTLELKTDDSGRLTGTASGAFVKDELAQLKHLKIDGNQISFEVAHRIANLRMAVTLERTDDKLKGEALPIDFEEDSCDILLQRRQLR